MDNQQTARLGGGVEDRILEDDRRRSGEFLRDFLSRHRVDTSDAADGNSISSGADSNGADSNGADDAAQ